MNPNNLICLTSREFDVLQLLVAGKSNRAIASEMSVCEKTVEFHLNNIYSKLGVRTRLETVIWAMTQGQREEN